MKIYGYIFLLMLLAIHACMEAQTYTGPQFYKLPSFDAMLLAKERIAHGASTPRTALTGVDYKIKLERADGTVIVITRLSTSMVGQICGTSDQMVVAALEVGKVYRFPDVIGEKPDCVKAYVED